MRLTWDQSGREDYNHWQTVGRQILKRINKLIDAALRNPYEGIGKPEQLKYGAAGAWSRRITEVHRLAYPASPLPLIKQRALRGRIKWWGWRRCRGERVCRRI